ncbi:glycoside hydrolase family 18 protein [Nonomuraea africana]
MMARHREPGTPPRPLVVLAALGLAAATGLAVWFLPAQATPDWSAAGPSPLAKVSAAPSPSPTPSAKPVPSGFVAFVDTARTPRFHLANASRRTGVRWFSLGRLMAGPGGCAPKWGGTVDPADDPVAGRVSGLRAAGGQAGLAFGGPDGSELAAACADQAALTSAYRRVIGAFGAPFVEFEVRDSADLPAVRRRATAVTALQREGDLLVTYTVPVGPGGLAPADLRMLEESAAAGARVTTVNLLVTIEPQAAGEGRMRRVAAALRAARRQVAEIFQVDPVTAWRRLAMTAVLAGPHDLSPLDARKLRVFAERAGMAWLSSRGASPPEEVARALWGEPPSRDHGS